jgi:hypothetical protein
MKKIIYVVERKFYGERVQLGFSLKKEEAKKFIKEAQLDDAWITPYEVTKKFKVFIS